MGASWHRVALQVNPYTYRGGSQPSNRFEDERRYNEAIVRACLDAEPTIDLIAIADHWRARSAESLAKAAEDAGIVVLPGFEAGFQRGHPPAGAF